MSLLKDDRKCLHLEAGGLVDLLVVPQVSDTAFVEGHRLESW